MFQGLFKRAESSVDNLVAKYVGRAVVAIPLLVAAGFATAALTVELVSRYGAVSAYAAMAALFAVVGLLTMAATRPGAAETSAETQGDPAPGSPSANGEQQASAGDGLSLPPELMAILTSAAPMALPGIARGVGRNLPLIFALALLTYIISRFTEIADTEGEPAAAPEASAFSSAPSGEPEPSVAA
jgi:hypothetical protein